MPTRFSVREYSQYKKQAIENPKAFLSQLKSLNASEQQELLGLGSSMTWQKRKAVLDLNPEDFEKKERQDMGLSFSVEEPTLGEIFLGKKDLLDDVPDYEEVTKQVPKEERAERAANLLLALKVPKEEFEKQPVFHYLVKNKKLLVDAYKNTNLATRQLMIKELYDANKGGSPLKTVIDHHQKNPGQSIKTTNTRAFFDKECKGIFGLEAFIDRRKQSTSSGTLSVTEDNDVAIIDLISKDPEWFAEDVLKLDQINRQKVFESTWLEPGIAGKIRSRESILDKENSSPEKEKAEKELSLFLAKHSVGAQLFNAKGSPQARQEKQTLAFQILVDWKMGSEGGGHFKKTVLASTFIQNKPGLLKAFKASSPEDKKKVVALLKDAQSPISLVVDSHQRVSGNIGKKTATRKALEKESPELLMDGLLKKGGTDFKKDPDFSHYVDNKGLLLEAYKQASPEQKKEIRNALETPGSALSEVVDHHRHMFHTSADTKTRKAFKNLLESPVKARPGAIKAAQQEAKKELDALSSADAESAPENRSDSQLNI